MNNQFNITISYNSETKYKWKKGQYTTSFCTSGSHLKKIKSLLKKKPQAPPPLCGLIEKAISHLTEFNSKLLFYIIQICDKALIIIYVIYVNNICWRNNCFSMFKLTTVTPHVSVVSNTWITIQTLLMSSMWTSDVIQPEKNWACWEKGKLHQYKRKNTNFLKLFGSTDCYQKNKQKKQQKLVWLVSSLETQHSFLLCFLLVSLAGLEGDLQDFVSQSVPIQAVDRHGSLLVVRHGNEAETFALVGIEVSDHLHVDDGAEGPEHLPQDGLVRILTQIIDKDAPTAGWVPRNSAPTAHVVNAHWRKPGGK